MLLSARNFITDQPDWFDECNYWSYAYNPDREYFFFDFLMNNPLKHGDKKVDDDMMRMIMGVERTYWITIFLNDSDPQREKWELDYGIKTKKMGLLGYKEKIYTQ